MSTALDTIQRRLDELNRRIPAPLEPEARSKFVAVQSKAEPIFQAAFSDSAPSFVEGETLTQYRQRLLRKLKEHSARWKDVAMDMTGAALDQVEGQVYTDAQGAAFDPSTVPAGELREVITTDRTGRRISNFVGDPEACWGPYKAGVRNVTGIKTKFD